MKDHLILLTAEFPYGVGETFLESEIEILSMHFRKITIFHSKKTEIKRNLPLNCTTIQLTSMKNNFFVSILSSLFSLKFIKEISHVITNQKKKISIGIIKTALISFYRSNLIKSKIIESLPLSDVYNAIFYSYWCDDHAIAIALIKQKHKTFCITRAHGWDVYTENSKFNYLPFRSLIAENMNCIFPISMSGLNYINKYWKINCEIKLSHLGVNENSMLPINKSNKIIVSCSNLIPLKRIHLIIEALKKVKTELEWVHFGDGPELELLSKKAESLPENISYCWKGRQTNAEVLQFYKNHNPILFINVSSTEGIPVSIMEAFSFGIPCIATNVGGNNEIVNILNGFLLNENPTPNEIADVIEHLINLELNEFSMLKKEAFLTWQNKFNAKINYKSFVHEITSRIE